MPPPGISASPPRSCSTVAPEFTRSCPVHVGKRHQKHLGQSSCMEYKGNWLLHSSLLGKVARTDIITSWGQPRRRADYVLYGKVKTAAEVPALLRHGNVAHCQGRCSGVFFPEVGLFQVPGLVRPVSLPRAWQARLFPSCIPNLTVIQYPCPPFDGKS